MTPLEFYRRMIARGVPEDVANEFASEFHLTLDAAIQRERASLERAMAAFVAGAEGSRMSAESDARERKRAADRERISARRAADRAANAIGYIGDSRATPSATVAATRDSEEIPPAPALSPQTPLSHPHTPGEITTRAREGLDFGDEEDAAEGGAEDGEDSEDDDQKAGTPKRKFLIPEDWTPNPNERQYAVDRGMTEEDIDLEIINFRDCFIDKQERRPGWTRSWQRWCRIWAERRAKGPRMASRTRWSGNSGPSPGGFVGAIARKRGLV